jgi:hypothetical protein
MRFFKYKGDSIKNNYMGVSCNQNWLDEKHTKIAVVKFKRSSEKLSLMQIIILKQILENSVRSDKPR